jgi:hypothetical protein
MYEITPDYKMLFISSMRARDVELSEDLYRRLGPCSSINELNNFLHGLLAQYRGDTLHLRGALLDTQDYDRWITSFNANVLPYLIRNRLPSCTDTAAQPQYHCESKDIL